MNTFKITNKTNTFGKRDINYNRLLKIDYVDNMIKRVIDLRPNESIYLSIQSLPLSVHRLRMKNFITVEEIDKKMVEKLNKKNKISEPKKVNVSKDVNKPKKVEDKSTDVDDKVEKKSYKKKSTKDYKYGDNEIVDDMET